MKNKKLVVYVIWAFIWSAVMWGAAIFIANKNGVTLLQHSEFVNSILTGKIADSLVLPTVLTLLGTYGPLIAALVVISNDRELIKAYKSRFSIMVNPKWVIQIIVLFLVITGIPSIPLMISGATGSGVAVHPVIFILLVFVYELFTSATEEFGWRGYMLPELLKTMTPWKASVKLGIIWGLWHMPIVLYIFFIQGLATPQIITSFVGFVAGTVAMSVIHTYYFLKSGNVFLSVLIHTVGNTVPMIYGMFTGESYVVAVSVQVLLWVVVIVLTKKEKVLFDTLQDVK